MALQTLPPLARSYSAAQRADIDDTLAEIAAQWRRIGPRFDTGWMLVGPYITGAVVEAQRRMVRRADEYVPDVLEDTNQVSYLEPDVEPVTSGLVGLTGAGYPVGDSLSAVTIRAKEAVAAGATTPGAISTAGSWLGQSAMTVLADTMRGAEGLSRYSRNVGYIRMVHGGACGRCVVQAGKWFRTNAGFLRHPRCRCTHVPASEDVGGDWQTNPDAYFNSLSGEQQIKLMGSKSNAQAVLDGADISQLVNAYSRSAGMQFAQVSPISSRNGIKFTSSGTTRRAGAAQQQAALRRNGPSQMRVMPESIYRRAPNREEALRQMKLYGWITDDAARAQGRAVLTEARRVERNARAVARRAERGWYDD
jgi:hypothetical protein